MRRAAPTRVIAHTSVSRQAGSAPSTPSDLRGSLRRGGSHQEPPGFLLKRGGRDRGATRKLGPELLPSERTAAGSDIRSSTTDHRSTPVGRTLGCARQGQPRNSRHEGQSTMTKLSGKTALVTGASRGMGRASALALAGMGAQVLVHYSSGVKDAEAVVAEIRNGGGPAHAVAADLSAPDGAHKLAKQVRAVVGDRPDILVRNAGTSKSATIEETTVEDFDRLFAVNVRAPFFLVQQLLPIMCKDSSIVLVSSLAAHAAVGTLSAYAARRARCCCP